MACLPGQKSSAFLPRYPLRACAHPHYDVTWAGSLAAPPAARQPLIREVPCLPIGFVLLLLDVLQRLFDAFFCLLAPSAEPRWAGASPPAVVNGQVVRLNDRNYELLQMIRVARAIL